MNEHIPRKIRRRMAKALPSLGGFKPQYNGKAPITNAQYEANNNVPAPPKLPKTRKYGVIKAVLPKKMKAKVSE